MQALPQGISSAARRLPDLDGVPFAVARSHGAHLTDDRGRDLIDLGMAMGATILGHAHPAVVAACTQALADGPMPGFPHAAEPLAAQALVADAGPLTRATFVTTGSEAVHLATRIARATTGRPVIAKVAAGFNGWYDEMAFGWSGSPEAATPGPPRPTRGNVTLLRWNDPDDLRALFAERGDIAAVLVEPVLANAGCLMPDPGWLDTLATTARSHGALVIADEVLMGLRLHAGPSSLRMGLAPDLLTMGKAIGSGLPVAAVLGTEAAFAAVEDGRAPRAGTYHGNPLVCAAVLATLSTLRAADYAAMLARGDALRARIAQAFAALGEPGCTSGTASVFSIWRSADPPRTLAQARAALDPAFATALHLELRRQGVVTIPGGGWGRWFLSFAHDDATLDAVARAFAAALPRALRP